MFKKTMTILAFLIYALVIPFSGMFELVHAESGEQFYENYFYKTENIRGDEYFLSPDDSLGSSLEFDFVGKVKGNSYKRNKVKYENILNANTLIKESNEILKEHGGKEVYYDVGQYKTGNYYLKETKKEGEGVKKGDIYPIEIVGNGQDKEYFDGSERIYQDYYGNQYLKDGENYKIIGDEKGEIKKQTISMNLWIQQEEKEYLDKTGTFYDEGALFEQTEDVKYKYNFRNEKYVSQDNTIHTKDRFLYASQKEVSLEKVKLFLNGKETELTYIKFYTSGKKYIAQDAEIKGITKAEDIPSGLRLEPRVGETDVLQNGDDKLYRISLKTLYISYGVGYEVGEYDRLLDAPVSNGQELEYSLNDIYLELKKSIIDTNNKQLILKGFKKSRMSGNVLLEHNLTTDQNGLKLSYSGKEYNGSNGSYLEKPDERLNEMWLSLGEGTVLYKTYKDKNGFNIDVPIGQIRNNIDKTFSYKTKENAILTEGREPIPNYNDVDFYFSGGELNKRHFFEDTVIYFHEDSTPLKNTEIFHVDPFGRITVKKGTITENSKIMILELHYSDGTNYTKTESDEVEIIYSETGKTPPNTKPKFESGDYYSYGIENIIFETGLSLNKYNVLKNVIKTNDKGEPESVIVSKTKGESKVLEKGEKVKLNGKNYEVEEGDIKRSQKDDEIYEYQYSIKFVEKTIDKGILTVIIILSIGFAFSAVTIFLIKKK